MACSCCSIVAQEQGVSEALFGQIDHIKGLLNLKPHFHLHHLLNVRFLVSCTSLGCDYHIPAHCYEDVISSPLGGI